jgi:hypothetical protein
MNRLFIALLCLAPLAAFAADDEYTLVISEHRFQPSEITIPANKKIKLLIENKDEEAEEFDSRALNREKVVPGKSSGIVFIGPLAPGRYAFQGEFHADTAQGAIVAR